MRKLFICLILLVGCLFSCVEAVPCVEIVNGEELTLEVGENIKLEAKHNYISEEIYTWYAMNSCVSVDENGVVTALSEGTCIVRVTIDNYRDSIVINVVDNSLITLTLSCENTSLNVGDTTTLSVDVSPMKPSSGISFDIVNGNDCISINGNIVKALKAGTAYVVAKYKEFVSNQIAIVVKEEILTDPYENMSYAEFYANYSKATSSTDAYYRSLHGFMSGDISKQDQEPTIAQYQPMINGKYVRNTSSIYSSDGSTYYIVDGYGNIVNEIYKEGAYVTLEEVAAYVLAFGDIPANYVSKKSGSPSTSIWKQYLRLNHSAFSGDTSKYPYEPKLPNISGCGGDLYYYEIDLGTTGTDCDPGYEITDYNNGSKITRGAARIVYTRYDKNKNNIIDINEKYVFYTYNHYNDFQEYLNYEGGWGEKFGNVTGGGTLSSKYDYNPTPYVEVERYNLYKEINTISFVEFIYIPLKKEDLFV